MNKSNNDVFAANLRVSEALKAELVEALSDLFKATLKNDHTKPVILGYHNYHHLYTGSENGHRFHYAGLFS